MHILVFSCKIIQKLSKQKNKKSIVLVQPDLVWFVERQDKNDKNCEK